MLTPTKLWPENNVTMSRAQLCFVLGFLGPKLIFYESCPLKAKLMYVSDYVGKRYTNY